jgi:glycosyltransferase involved in cell wall biosynthesis
MITSAHAVYGDVLRWETGDVRPMVQAQAFFDRVSMEQADRVTCGSDYARQRILDLYHIDPYKVTTIPHGIMPQNWMRLAHKMERHENDHPILLAVGKMYPRKRLDILLNAMPALVGLHPNVELRIAGDGLEFDKMRALSQSLGIERNVTWLGHVADDVTFAREWVQADVFCHPSLQETFGFVYLEAMSLGKPIVASNAGAAPEVVGGCGLLVDEDDSVGFANALDRLLLDADLRRTLGACGRKRAAAYTQRRMIDGYVSLMDDLLDARAGYRNGNGHQTLLTNVKWQ